MPTTLITPATTTAAVAGDDKLTYWKQILPENGIDYTDPASGQTRHIDFDDGYFNDLIESFNTGAVDQLCVQVADKNNSHGPAEEDMSPEAQRAEVLEVKRVRKTDLSNDFDKPGLWGRVRFFNKKAARMVRDNPKLGVSARIREDWPRGDGRYVKRAMVHVLATIDPYNNGMAPWRLADMSMYDGRDEVILDLSHSTYRKDAKMAKNKGRGQGGGTATLERLPDDLTELTDDQLNQLAARLGIDLSDLPDDDDDDNESDDDDDEGDTSGEFDTDAPGTESVREARPRGQQTTRTGNTDLSVVSNTANAALARADEALRVGAQAQWDAERDTWQRRGVPPAVIDLAMPYVSRPGGFTIDLSVDGVDKRQDVAADMRRMLEHMAGYVDLAVTTGHGGQFENAEVENDDDAEVLDAWEAQHPLS